MFGIGIGPHRIRGFPRLLVRRENGTITTSHSATAIAPTTRSNGVRSVLPRRERRSIQHPVWPTPRRSVPRAVTLRGFAVDEEAVPPLEAEQRPDQQSVVDAPLDVLGERSADCLLAEPAAIERSRIEEDLLDVLHR